MELFDLLLFRCGLSQSLFAGRSRARFSVRETCRRLEATMERHAHLQVVACLGVLSTQCAVQQIFAIACLKSGIQRFNDYSGLESIGAVLVVHPPF